MEEKFKISDFVVLKFGTVPMYINGFAKNPFGEDYNESTGNYAECIWEDEEKSLQKMYIHINNLRQH